MKPKKPKQRDHEDLFRSRLDQILDRRHPLYLLANQIEWSVFDKKFGSLYAEKGRPAKSTRLLVGLHYLKHAFDESDESVVARLLENPYWQYFCGFEYFIHRLPLDPSSMTRWRKRIGPKEMELLLSETLETAKRGGNLTEQHMERVNVDTTVQEKAIAYPTDGRLYHKARVLLVRAAKKRGIALRQSYLRLGKQALIMSGRYAHARQMRRARREQKKLKNYLGRAYRNILRNCPEPDLELKELLHLANRLLTQQRHDKNKLYSLHAPEVECIAKGKAHKKYEFGCKVSVVTTSQDNWVIGIEALHNNPFDGHTLKDALKQVTRLVGWKPQNAYCDRGYQGNPKKIGDTAIHLANRRKSSMKPSEWRWFQRRNAIEPVIGHMKEDHRMDRNYLKGTEGDKMNAILAACGFNLRKLLRAFFWLLFKELERLKSPLIGVEFVLALLKHQFWISGLRIKPESSAL
ncbi:IS5 family transposase [Desulfuromonas sp. CSMB_57]|uniref:IS5 family transposase n=1 Tax=Desulfuromonas sp. CSMB_57 TaxID=2807629 RepID=UPI0032E034C5